MRGDPRAITLRSGRVDSVWAGLFDGVKLFAAFTLQKAHEILRQRVFELEPLALQRMGEAQGCRVQQGAGALDGRARAISPVQRIAHDGVTDLREVDPDLMSA